MKFLFFEILVFIFLAKDAGYSLWTSPHPLIDLLFNCSSSTTKEKHLFSCKKVLLQHLSGTNSDLTLAYCNYFKTFISKNWTNRSWALTWPSSSPRRVLSSRFFSRSASMIIIIIIRMVSDFSPMNFDTSLFTASLFSLFCLWNLWSQINYEVRLMSLCDH